MNILWHSRLRLACETYLVGQDVCLQLSKGKLESSILAVVQRDLDGNRSVRRQGRVGIRHGCSVLGARLTADDERVDLGIVERLGPKWPSRLC